jgi:hypothetical protein
MRYLLSVREVPGGEYRHFFRVGDHGGRGGLIPDRFYPTLLRLEIGACRPQFNWNRSRYLTRG